MSAAGRRWALLLMSLGMILGCRSTPAEVAEQRSAVAPKASGTAMPESLRCRQAGDCVQKPSCYWETPSCVAAAGLTREKCGDDADPSNSDYPAVVCECFEGQCVPK